MLSPQCLDHIVVCETQTNLGRLLAPYAHYCSEALPGLSLAKDAAIHTLIETAKLNDAGP